MSKTLRTVAFWMMVFIISISVVNGHIAVSLFDDPLAVFIYSLISGYFIGIVTAKYVIRRLYEMGEL